MRVILWVAFLVNPMIIYSQSSEWSSEIQSSFIDISGLFGLDEAAQVTTVQYRKGSFFVDGFHSFSWKEPGRTIQSFVGAGYTFQLDSISVKTLSVKNDFAFNRIANNGSFLRPTFTTKWDLSGKHSLYILSWLFLDTRRETAQSLNGGGAYLAHRVTLQSNRVIVRNEFRVLYLRIKGIRKVSGVVNQLKLIANDHHLYIVGNLGRSYYREGGFKWILNVGAGKTF